MLQFFTVHSNASETKDVKHMLHETEQC